MTGQTIKCQCADLGATGLHHDPLNISHSTPAATTGRREKKNTSSPLLSIHSYKYCVVHCLVVMIKRCTALWK